MHHSFTIQDAAAELADGRLTSESLTRACLARADELDERLGVFLDRYDETALETAAASDERRARGFAPRPLEGIPVAVKDIITTREGPTTAQSVVFDSSSLSGDAPVVDRLRTAGAVILGKTSTMEFAIGTPDEDKPFPVPRNPWDPSTWPGGSSSGTGAGVAADMFLGGLGTDTGGSIRIPAANCGITGLKATYGRVPKNGCVPLGFTLDHIGPMARSAYDCALMLNVLAGHNPGDPTSSTRAVEDYTSRLSGDLTGMRIGIDRLERKYTEWSVASDVAAMFDRLEEQLVALGAEVVDLALPFYDEVASAALLLMIVEGYAYHRHDLQRRWQDYSRGLRDCLGMGPFYSAADAVQAQRVRRVGQHAVSEMFSGVDAVITPTSSAPAFDFHSVDNYWDGPSTTNYTGYWNATGSPTLSVPGGFTTEGLPLGLQISGSFFDESAVLKVGHALQQVTEHHLASAPVLQNA